MKKLFPLLMVTVLLAAACSSIPKDVKKDSEKISFEYTAMTRGAFKKVIVKQDTVITVKDRAMKEMVTKKLDASDWNKILALLAKTDVQAMESLTPPSTKNHADAALAANLRVIRGDKTYQSSTFDYGNPPKEIKELVEKIIEVSDLGIR